MIKPEKYGENTVSRLTDRKSVYSDEAEETVRRILADVKEKGDEAVRHYTEKFDAVPENIQVTDSEMEEALAAVDESYLGVLKRSAENIAAFHRKQLREGYEIRDGGRVLGQKFTPVESAGLYIPGGTAAYPSTVLMNAVPAKIAGVKDIIMVSPPKKDGKIKNEVLAAAKIAGVDKIFKIGGAQAIAALAYGTESIPKVDTVVGPGNIYVAVAKKQIYGTCGIDMVAGPSEILVIADGDADPVCVAADLLSQAEHDAMASAILLTDSASLADAVSAELERQLRLLDRESIARASIENNCRIIVCPDTDTAVRLSNEFAPEHLELALKNPFAYLGKVENAGSVFLGYNTPEPVGDYYAGANHTLPTGGTAKFASPLSVDNFMKSTQYMYYTEDNLKDASQDIIDFAESEGLTAHARAIEVRVKK